MYGLYAICSYNGLEYGLNLNAVYYSIATMGLYIISVYNLIPLYHYCLIPYSSGIVLLSLIGIHCITYIVIFYHYSLYSYRLCNYNIPTSISYVGYYSPTYNYLLQCNYIVCL